MSLKNLGDQARTRLSAEPFLADFPTATDDPATTYLINLQSYVTTKYGSKIRDPFRSKVLSLWSNTTVTHVPPYL